MREGKAMRRVAAFFDIDHTVLEVNSGTKWVSHQWRTRQLSVGQLLQAMRWLVEYRFGLLDYDAMARRILVGYRGREVLSIYREVEAFFERDVAWAICEQAREKIAHHREQGHVIALLTSATHFLSTPLAKVLDVEHVLCTEVEVDAGVLTGNTIEPLCYGPGKVQRAECFAEAHDIVLEDSYFYSDSISDLPMLERVGHPRVVNPDPRLRRLAAARGWSYEIWKAPPRVVAMREHVESRTG